MVEGRLAVRSALAIDELKSMGVKLDTLTKEQEKYLNSWELGT